MAGSWPDISGSGRIYSGLTRSWSDMIKLHIAGSLPGIPRFCSYSSGLRYIEKNVLESILNTLLMNDKSKDTAKARQDLKRLGIESGLWLGQTKNGKCSKPQATYSFTLENKKKGFVSSSKELNYQMGSDPTSSTK
ncbi:hypothetical protein Tco_0380183 [Tanacetum coccineum]